MEKNIVVIAHDRKKPVLSDFLKEREQWLIDRTILATGRTAEFIEKSESKLQIKHLSPGRSGGYKEITKLITEGNVQLVFFFHDPEVEYAYHPDIRELMDTCIESDVPLALNGKSAEMLIIGLIRMELASK
ncbi:MAG: methylglyoxal synthase [Flavobacteriales bacterium]|nr:methylglyoxal synthase [Flavobacteriales bacterium]NNK81396.1 methylglyoxal synthase [Flavobacteriales bacterium]